jgi:hypothetical protein
MTVKELKARLIGLPEVADDWEAHFDDPKGGKIPVEEFRVERPLKFDGRNPFASGSGRSR